MVQPRILIVEDEGLIALEIETHLQNFGYHVVETVVSGAEAIQKAFEHQPDLILMDIRLQGRMSGLEASVAILFKLNIPIVYLTAHSDRGTLRRAKLTLPYGYIVKPFDEQILQKTIEAALHNHKTHQSRLERKGLISNLPDFGSGLLVADGAGKVSYMNAVAETVTGWTQEEALTQPVRTIFSVVYQATNQPAEDVLNQAYEQDQIIQFQQRQVHLVTKDGSVKEIEGKIIPLASFESDSSPEIIVLFSVSG